MDVKTCRQFIQKYSYPLIAGGFAFLSLLVLLFSLQSPRPSPPSNDLQISVSSCLQRDESLAEENALLKHQLRELSEELASAKESALLANSTLSEREGSLLLLQKSSQQLLAQRNELEQALNERNREVNELSSQARETHEVIALSDHNSGLDPQLLRERCTALYELVVQERERLSAAERELRLNEEYQAQLEIENMAMRERCERLARQINESQHSLSETQSKLVKNENVVHRFSREIEESRDALANLKREFAQLSEYPTKTSPQLIRSFPPRTHTVQKGETLSSISQHYFGTPKRWVDIQQLNSPKIDDVRHLRAGSTILIPPTQQSNNG